MLFIWIVVLILAWNVGTMFAKGGTQAKEIPVNNTYQEFINGQMYYFENVYSVHKTESHIQIITFDPKTKSYLTKIINR